MKRLYLVFAVILMFTLFSCKKEKTYKITWQDDDETILQIDEKVPSGEVPTYSGDTPKKIETDEYYYEFTGWTPEVEKASEDKIYTATYSSTKRGYNVIFKDDDEVILSEQVVEYGLSATPPTDPEKVGFTFTGWDKDYDEIKGDLVITAVYEEDLFTITWENDDGTILKTDENVTFGKMPIYVGTPPTKTETAEFNYIFTGWSPKIVSVTEDITYRATYSSHKRSYTVTFKNDNGFILSVQVIEYGLPATPPSDPVKVGSTFTGWDKDFDVIKGDLVITAVYEEDLFTITWKNDDGTILKTDEDAAFGKMPVYTGPIPEKASTEEFSYTFNGWTPVIILITGDKTYTATYSSTKRSYEVIFKDGDIVLSEQTVEYGLAATPPKDPEKVGHSFTGWDKDYDEIKGDVVIYAVFEINLYIITWKNYDETILDTNGKVAYGNMPIYSGLPPEKPQTEEFYYTFTGWNPEVIVASEDKTYTATYSEHIRSFSVTFRDYNGIILTVVVVEYGLAAKAPEDPSRYGYTFTGWDKDFDIVKNDLIVTAVYKENLLTVTWKNEDGTILKVDEDITPGTVPNYTGDTPTKEPTHQYTYTFNGWNPVVTEVYEDQTYIAKFIGAQRRYSVSFKDYDDLVILQTDVPYGTNVLPPPGPNRKPGHTFSGWDKDFSFVVEDMVINAVYEINTYTVVFKNDDGTILQQDDDVPYLTVPEYTSDTPTKISDGNYVYEFSGFSPVISPVVKNITYTAQFKPVYYYPEYYVLLTDEDFTGAGDGWVIYNGSYEYIIIPEYIKGVKVTKAAINKDTRLLKNKPFVKGVVFENPHNITDASFLFYKHQSEELELDYLYLPYITTTESMFEDSKALYLDLTKLDTSNVTKMNKMFKYAEAEVIDLTGFNTSKVTNFTGMFYGTYATTLDLSSFDTSKATTMEEMFTHTKSVSVNLSSFNTSKVSNMRVMFYGSQMLELDLSSFDTSLITSMISMFAFTEALSINLSSFNTSNVTDMSYMFNQAKATTLDLSSFDTSKVYNMDRMFYLSKAKSIDFSTFDTSKVSNMSSMFENSRIEVLDLSTFDFSSLLFASSIFKNCSATIGYLATEELCERFNKQLNIFTVK